MADNINDIEEFGDLPPNLLRRLSQILSKRRVITPRTLQLFLRSDLESIDIYDCASKVPAEVIPVAGRLTQSRTGNRGL